MTHTLARRRKHRICHRRGNWRDSHFADPRGRRITLNKVDVDLGRLVKTQQRVIVEVALLDHPIFNRDPCLERGGQAKDDPTLHLGNHRRPG